MKDSNSDFFRRLSGWLTPAKRMAGEAGNGITAIKPARAGAGAAGIREARHSSFEQAMDEISRLLHWRRGEADKRRQSQAQQTAVTPHENEELFRRVEDIKTRLRAKREKSRQAFLDAFASEPVE